MAPMLIAGEPHAALCHFDCILTTRGHLTPLDSLSPDDLYSVVENSPQENRSSFWCHESSCKAEIDESVALMVLFLVFRKLFMIL